MEKKNKRLIADIPAEVHKELKVRAAQLNITLTKYILQALLEKMVWEDKYK